MIKRQAHRHGQSPLRNKPTSPEPTTRFNTKAGGCSKSGGRDSLTSNLSHSSAAPSSSLATSFGHTWSPRSLPDLWVHTVECHNYEAPKPCFTSLASSIAPPCFGYEVVTHRFTQPFIIGDLRLCLLSWGGGSVYCVQTKYESKGTVIKALAFQHRKFPFQTGFFTNFIPVYSHMILGQ